jgi:hypothetical protein
MRQTGPLSRRIVFWSLFLMVCWHPAPGLAGGFYAEVERIPVLSALEWERLYGGSSEIPGDDEAVLRLARKAYPAGAMGEIAPVAPMPDGRKRPGTCGTDELDRLFAALQSPYLNPGTRKGVRRIIRASVPPLEKEHLTEHFRIRFTTESLDPWANVTEEQVIAIGKDLEKDFANYSKHFRPPKNTGALISVYIYYPGRVSWRGRTSFFVNSIELNSRWAQNRCISKVDTSHELFHRVQYAYMAQTEPGQKYWMEGTAKWAEELRHPGINDYVGWANVGLGDPEKPFLARSYDSVLFWVYLGERFRSKGGTPQGAIGSLLGTYESGKRGRELLARVVKGTLGMSLEELMQDWHKANYIKDTVDPPDKYNYYDNQTPKLPPCKMGGPYERVDRRKLAQPGIQRDSYLSHIEAGGAIYRMMNVNPGQDLFGIQISDSFVDFSLSHQWDDGDILYTVVTEKNGKVKDIFDLKKADIICNIIPKVMDIDRVMLVIAAHKRDVFVRITINPQSLNGEWSVEETWDNGWKFNNMWVISKDKEDVSPVDITVTAKSYDGAVWTTKNGTGRRVNDDVTVAYDCFKCTDGGRYSFTGTMTPDSSYREMSGTFTYGDGTEAGTEHGTWKASRLLY